MLHSEAGVENRPQKTPVPYISLDNFEDSEFENAKYILTSPKSLEACNRLSIKPIELIYKNLSSFQILHSKSSVAEINRLYLQNEDARRNKLRLCRDIRNALIAEEVCSSKPFSTLEVVGKSVFNDTQPCSPKPPQGSQSVPLRPKNSLNRPQTAQELLSNRTLTDTSRCHTRNPSAIYQREWQNGTRPNNFPTPLISLHKEREFWMRRRELEEKRQEEIEMRRKEYEERLAAAESKQERLRKEREHHIQSTQMTRERKQKEISARKLQLDEEIEHYQKNLQEYGDRTLEVAREKTLQKTAAEQQRLAFERQQRELKRQANLEALATAEEARRQSVLEVLRQKEERAQRSAEERDKMLQKTKNLAFATEQLREEIRRAFKLDSFDKMAHRAQLINDLGLGNDV